MNMHPLAAWLRTRTPEPPPELAARIEAMARGSDSNSGGSESDADDASSPEYEPDPNLLIVSATAAMTKLLEGGCLTRESALDLLAIDALVTYAFEAAADDPDRIEARAEHALTSISTLAEPYAA